MLCAPTGLPLFSFFKYKKLETRVLEEFYLLLLFGIAHLNQLHHPAGCNGWQSSHFQDCCFSLASFWNSASLVLLSKSFHHTSNKFPSKLQICHPQLPETPPQINCSETTVLLQKELLMSLKRKKRAGGMMEEQKSSNFSMDWGDRYQLNLVKKYRKNSSSLLVFF